MKLPFTSSSVYLSWGLFGKKALTHFDSYDMDYRHRFIEIASLVIEVTRPVCPALEALLRKGYAFPKVRDEMDSTIPMITLHDPIAVAIITGSREGAISEELSI